MNARALKEAAAAVGGRMPDVCPAVALILGSGWGSTVEGMRILHETAYAGIPLLGPTGVHGHRGRLLVGELGSTVMLVFEGRRHWYEGEGWEPVAFPLYLCLHMRVPALIITNAAGGIREDLDPGSLMVIDDHINAMGVSPLVGPRDTALGARFPDQTEVYSKRLRGLLHEAAGGIGVKSSHGIYLAVSGPSYETPAEIRAYRSMGADAIGMSTVPEAMLAHAGGMEVAGISCITNRAAGTGERHLSHDEVVAVTRDCAPRMRALLEAFAACAARTGGRT